MESLLATRPFRLIIFYQHIENLVYYDQYSSILPGFWPRMSLNQSTLPEGPIRRQLVGNSLAWEKENILDFFTWRKG